MKKCKIWPYHSYIYLDFHVVLGSLDSTPHLRNTPDFHKYVPYGALPARNLNEISSRRRHILTCGFRSSVTL